jgi:hypothetical protein
MLGFAHFVEVAFLPCVALALALSVAWRFIANGALRTFAQWAAALLFFVPQPFVLYLGAYSARLRLYQQALLSVLGFGIAALVVIALLLPQSALMRRLQTRSRKAGPVTWTAVALAMAVLGAYCAWNVVGDYMLERDVISGRVEGMRVVHHRRSPDSYQVIIAKRPHDIPLELLLMLHPDEEVQAEIGIASGTILAIHTNAVLRSQSPRAP